MEDNYPKLRIDTSGRVLAEGKGWRWTVTVHFIGPDSKVEANSRVFKTRQECFINLVSLYPQTIQLLLDKYDE